MTLPEKQAASLIGVVIGDALGLPVEAHTRHQILWLLNQQTLGAHDGLLSEYLPIGRHGMYRPHIASGTYPFLQSSATGVCSDDTLLTLAIHDSLRTQGGVDMDDIMHRHIQAVKNEPFGFGKGTRATVEKIADGADWSNLRVSSFGNGVMMKQSPFAFYEAISQMRVSDDLIRLAQITHNHPVSLVITKVHHRLLIDIILSDSPHFDMAYWLHEGIAYAKACEAEFQADAHVSRLMYDIQRESDAIASLEDIAERYVRKIDTEKNAYFNVLSTLGICYAIFLRRKNFEAIQQGASIGGDTDSYASILGSMVGALQGNIFNPKYMDDVHPRYKEKIDASLYGLS